MSSHPAASSIPSRLSTPQPLPHLQQKGKEKASANEQASGLPAQPKSSILDSPMERFDFEDFRARFDAAMEPHMIRDRELVEEYKRIAATFQAWVSVMGQFDQQSDLTRRESQISNLNQKEAELEAYRKQSQSAVQDIQNILDKMGSAPRYETNSIGSPNPKRNAATYHGPQHRLGRSFMGNKVPGSASLKK
ncbi:hypothetical protein BDZ91DRAFT_720634 [Kalaharituber pfeilii]|nr:hypothetical protein BDZ91DRAFT_720634 [Kalaharituber pfeilii]